ncbi:Ank3 [Symbiodinium sp. KB8]|nr:Ank3 [Symbiodinium sp. KB8]
MPPLHAACAAGHMKAAFTLIQADADVDQEDARGASALLLAAQNGHKEVVRLLLQEGADEAKVTSWGFTPLAAAVENGHPEIVELLKRTAFLRLESSSSDTYGKSLHMLLHVCLEMLRAERNALHLWRTNASDASLKGTRCEMDFQENWCGQAIGNATAGSKEGPALLRKHRRASDGLPKALGGQWSCCTPSAVEAAGRRCEQVVEVPSSRHGEPATESSVALDF